MRRDWRHWAIIAGMATLRPSAAGAAVAGFEEFGRPPRSLPAESYYNGSDGAGGFVSGGAQFNNSYTDFGGGYYMWSGWAVSNVTDNTTPGYDNQYSAFAGRGAGGSSFYAVGFPYAPTCPTIELPPGARPQSLAVTNTTYAALSMRQGDFFAKKFGGATGNDPDWFKLTITGRDEGGASLGEVEFYLADYRFADNGQDYVVDEWTTVDLSSLTSARSLDFALDSSDVGPWGVNTPTYFAIDNLVLTPEPAAIALLALAAPVVFGRSRGRRRFRQLQSRVGPGRLAAMVVLLGLPASTWGQSPFAVTVEEYAPAPGAFVNDPLFNDPAKAVGRPYGNGFSEPGNSSLVTLGGFGGSIVLGFDHTVGDDAANPFGIDAIIYGNSFWVGGNPNRRWAEAGVIEISRDANSNGVADDPWYLIPGSHLADPPGQWAMQGWDDDPDDPTYPPDDAAWIPPGRTGEWATAGYRLPPGVFDANVLVNPNGLNATIEGVYGYADLSPTSTLPAGNAPEEFYVRPDNPWQVGLTPGCGGGDGFDIAWAIDLTTGAPADLDGFDFIRIATGVNFIDPLLGEKSTEIDAVADVAEGRLGDAEGDGDIDLADYSVLNGCLSGPGGVAPTSPCRVVDFDQNGGVDLADYAAFQRALGTPP